MQYRARLHSGKTALRQRCWALVLPSHQRPCLPGWKGLCSATLTTRARTAGPFRGKSLLWALSSSSFRSCPLGMLCNRPAVRTTCAAGKRPKHPFQSDPGPAKDAKSCPRCCGAELSQGCHQGTVWPVHVTPQDQDDQANWQMTMTDVR